MTGATEIRQQYYGPRYFRWTTDAAGNYVGRPRRELRAEARDGPRVATDGLHPLAQGGFLIGRGHPISTIDARPRKARNPITSVRVVTKVPDASAGSSPSRCSPSGTSTPPSAATT